jgi:hypothetical protein
MPPVDDAARTVARATQRHKATPDRRIQDLLGMTQRLRDAADLALS